MRFYKTFILLAAMPLAVSVAQASVFNGGASLRNMSQPNSLTMHVDFDPAVTAKRAEKTIADLGDQAISTLEAETDHSKRLAVFDRILNDSFDMDTIARFSLGRYWSVATPAEQKKYVGLFKKMVIDVYSQRFEGYAGQKFDVKGSKPVGRKDVLVNSLIVSPHGKPPVKVDWRLRKGKIIDVVVEGVSMSVTQRSEFNSIIQRNGGKVSALIEHLEK